MGLEQQGHAHTHGALPESHRDHLTTVQQAERVRQALLEDDMFSLWGIRSTSSKDPRYNNDNVIKPYR